MSRSLRLAEEAKAIFEAADQANRALTSDERVHVESLLDRARERHDAEAKLKDLGVLLGPATPGGFTDPARVGGFHNAGEAFVASEGYKAIRQGLRGETWTTGLVDCGDVGLSMKGTLLEGSGSPGSGTGGAWLGAPQVIPGVVDKLFQPLTLADLILSGQARPGSVRYVVEGTATSERRGRRR